MCDRCPVLEKELDRVREAAVDDLNNLTALIAAETRRRKKAERALAEQMGTEKNAGTIGELCDLWRDVCNHPRSKTPVGDTRWKAVRARLNEKWTPEELEQAIRGYGRFPYTGPGGQRLPAGPTENRWDDLELICRDAKHVEKGIELFNRRDDDQAGAPVPITAKLPTADFERIKARVLADFRARYRWTDPLETLFAALDELRLREQNFRAGRDGWTCCCPAHPDKTPSLSITQLPDGNVRLHCFAGCEQSSILEALGLRWRHLWGRDHFELRLEEYAERFAVDQAQGRELRAAA